MKGFISFFVSVFFLVISHSVFALEQVNINTADQKTLATVLEGVGPNKAQAIIDYRQANGKFESVDALVNIKGIGKKILKINQGKIVIDSE